MQLNLDNSKYYNELVSYFWESFLLESVWSWSWSRCKTLSRNRPNIRLLRNPGAEDLHFFVVVAEGLRSHPNFGQLLLRVLQHLCLSSGSCSGSSSGSRLTPVKKTDPG